MIQYYLYLGPIFENRKQINKQTKHTKLPNRVSVNVFRVKLDNLKADLPGKAVGFQSKSLFMYILEYKYITLYFILDLDLIIWL